MIPSDLIAHIKEVARFPDELEASRIISGFRWIGFFSSEKVQPRAGNLLDTLCARLEGLMKYEVGERDLVMLQHKFVVEWQDGKTVCLDPSPHANEIGLMPGYRILSRRPWRRMAIQPVTLPWLLPLVFHAVSLLSWFSMASSIKSVCSGRILRSSAILFAKFWKRKVSEWLKRFYEPGAYRRVLIESNSLYICRDPNHGG